MKIALFLILAFGMGLWSFKITKVVENNTNDENMEDSRNLLSKDKNVDNSNLFEEKII